MPNGGGQTTRNLRGAGTNCDMANAGTELDGVDYRGAKLTRIFWTLSNGETITPGSDGVPNRVVGMGWESGATGQAGCVFFDRDTRLGTAAAGGAYTGYLLVYSR